MRNTQRLHLALNTALTLGVLSCGSNDAEAPDQPDDTESVSSPVLGKVVYRDDCTDAHKRLLDKATFYGRTVAVSAAFRSCLDRAVRVGFAGIGPYMQCKNDPFYSSAPADALASQAYWAWLYSVNNDDLDIGCTGGAGNASSQVDTYLHSTPEAFQFSAWLTDVAGQLDLPLCTKGQKTGCRFAADPWPYSQAAGIIWHEASHQHGYDHGPSSNDAAKTACGYDSASSFNYQVNTMPYIIGLCMKEIITESASVCGPVEDSSCAAGLRLRGSIDDSSCTCVLDPAIPSVSWTKVGAPTSARKIAACADGRLYALNDDRTLYVNRQHGADGGWQYLSTPSSAQSITCSNNVLYAFNDDRTLWRSNGDDRSFTRIGKPSSAKQIVGASYTETNGSTAGAFYALNDDNTLWKSRTGTDGSWTRIGRPASADRIAAAGFLGNPYGLQPRVFALNTNKAVYLNSGDGCDQYWYYFNRARRAIELTATDIYTMYALNDDYTLWQGTISNSNHLWSVKFLTPMHCDGNTLVP